MSLHIHGTTKKYLVTLMEPVAAPPDGVGSRTPSVSIVKTVILLFGCKIPNQIHGTYGQGG